MIFYLSSKHDLRCHLKNNKTSNKCWLGCGESGTLILCLWECNVGQLLWKGVCQFLKSLNISLPYYPAIPILGIYPSESNTYVYAKTSIQMFTEALFIIAKTQLSIK